MVRKVGIASLVVVALALALPAIAYGIGLLMVNGRPTPADPSRYSSEAIGAAWQSCSEQMPVALAPLNPWSVAASIIWGDYRNRSAGETAAWQVARTHNAEHRVGGMWAWHLSGAALTIWITRNWSAEQIGATAIRDNLCT
jgi:hypothetical protein